MWCGHHTLPVDLDDAVPHTDATPLCDAPTHQAADLGVGSAVRAGLCSQLSPVTTAPNPHNPVELLPGVHTSSSPWARSALLPAE